MGKYWIIIHEISWYLNLFDMFAVGLVNVVMFFSGFCLYVCL